MLFLLIVFLVVLAVFASLYFTGVLFPNKSKDKKEKLQIEKVDENSNTGDENPDTGKEIDIQDKVTKSSENKNNEQVEIAIVSENIAAILNEMLERIEEIVDPALIDSEISKQITSILNHKAKNDELGFDNESQMVVALENLINKLNTGDQYYKSKSGELKTEIDKL
jgi:hypothetical protein